MMRLDVHGRVTKPPQMPYDGKADGPLGPNNLIN
jgi:hypothetical protein